MNELTFYNYIPCIYKTAKSFFLTDQAMTWKDSNEHDCFKTLRQKYLNIYILTNNYTVFSGL